MPGFCSGVGRGVETDWGVGVSEGGNHTMVGVGGAGVFVIEGPSCTGSPTEALQAQSVRIIKPSSVREATRFM